MSDNSKIEWTDITINPAPGCMHIAAGCEHCYAEKFAARLANMGQKKYQAVVRKGPTGKYLPQWNGQIYLDMAAIEALRKIKKPKMVFLQSMGDIFNEKIADSDIRKILAIVAECHWHTFQILTKRPQRLYDILSRFYGTSDGVKWPFDNVWLGVSCSNQAEADKNIPILLQIPATTRFVSLEPLLNAIRITQDALRSLDWVIVGGESGKGARPMHPQWVRDIRDQCVAADVPFFFKQWGGVNKKKAGRILDGRTWDEMPNGITSKK